ALRLLLQRLLAGDGYAGRALLLQADECLQSGARSCAARRESSRLSPDQFAPPWCMLSSGASARQAPGSALAERNGGSAPLRLVPPPIRGHRLDTREDGPPGRLLLAGGAADDSGQELSQVLACKRALVLGSREQGSCSRDSAGRQLVRLAADT